MPSTVGQKTRFLSPLQTAAQVNTLSAVKIKVILLCFWVGFYLIRHDFVKILCVFILSDVLDDAFYLFIVVIFRSEIEGWGLRSQ